MVERTDDLTPKTTFVRSSDWQFRPAVGRKSIDTDLGGPRMSYNILSRSPYLLRVENEWTWLGLAWAIKSGIREQD